MELQGKRVAILVEDNYEDLEVWYPVLRLREAGAEVTIIGREARSFASTPGLPVQADVNATQAQADDFEAIVIPGGSSAEAISQQPATLALIQEAIHQGKAAAIVHAGRPLSRGHDEPYKDVRVLFGMQEETLDNVGPYEGSAVIREGNRIRARTPSDLLAFCRMIIAALSAPPPPAATNVNQG